MKPFKALKDFSRAEKLVFFATSVTFILMTLPPTLENPLLPPEAARYKISSGIIGMMFSSAAVISVLSSMGEGILIAKFGPKIIMLCGIILNGVFNIFFGLLVLFKSTSYFTAGCFVCMGLDSIGTTAIYTATVTYGAKYFPTRMGFVMGTLEFYESGAEVMSFIVGGLLSEERGFLLPFVFFGSLQLVAFPLDIFILPKDKNVNPESEKESFIDLDNPEKVEGKTSMSSNEDVVPVYDEAIQTESIVLIEKKSSVGEAIQTVKKNSIVGPEKTEKTPEIRKKYKKLIFVPRVFFMEITLLANGIAWSFLNSTLEPHLSSLSLSKLQVNLVFLLTSLTYGVSSPLWGWASDRFHKRTWMFTSTGLIIAGLGFGFFLGPAPFMGLQNTVWLNCVTLIVTSSALSLAGVPSSAKILVYAIEAGYEDCQKLQGAVSSIIATTFCTGTIIGPLVGGYLLEKFGYPISSGLCGILVFSWGVITIFYFLTCDKCSDKARVIVVDTRPRSRLRSMSLHGKCKGIIFSPPKTVNTNIHKTDQDKRIISENLSTHANNKE